MIGLWDRNRTKAFYFDRGVWQFGRRVEGEMDLAESRVSKRLTNPKFKQQARQNAMSKILDGPNAKGRFKDPAVTKGPQKPAAFNKPEEEPEIVAMDDSFGG